MRRWRFAIPRRGYKPVNHPPSPMDSLIWMTQRVRRVCSARWRAIEIAPRTPIVAFFWPTDVQPASAGKGDGMNSKHLDASIQSLKDVLGDPSNELGSEQQRALAGEIRRLKRLTKQPHINRDELYRVVSKVAETVSEILRS